MTPPSGRRSGELLDALARDAGDGAGRDRQNQQHALDQHAHAVIEALERECLVECLQAAGRPPPAKRRWQVHQRRRRQRWQRR